VARPGRQRGRPHAHRRLEIPRHAPALRRLGRRRPSSGSPPAPLRGLFVALGNVSQLHHDGIIVEVIDGERHRPHDKRDELFVTTKLWVHDGEDGAKRAFEQSLARLGLDYLDRS
jgi:hypothetical protein